MMQLMVIPLQATVPMEMEARMTAALLEGPLLMETLLMEAPQATALQATALQATVPQMVTPRAVAHKAWVQKETALMMVPVLVLATITTELLVVILVPLLDHLKEADPALEVTQMIAKTLATAPGQDQDQALGLTAMVREMGQLKILDQQDLTMAMIPLTGQVTAMAAMVTVLVMTVQMMATVQKMAVPGTLSHLALAHKLHHPQIKPVVYKAVEAQMAKTILRQTTHYLLVVHQQPLGQQDPRILHRRMQGTRELQVLQLIHHRPPSCLMAHPLSNLYQVQQACQATRQLLF
jgi:hypothetical protein